MSRLLKEYFDDESEYDTGSETEGEYYSDEEYIPTETPETTTSPSEVFSPSTTEYLFKEQEENAKLTLNDIVEKKDEKEKYYKNRLAKRAKDTARVQQQHQMDYDLSQKEKEDLLTIAKEQEERQREKIKELLQQGMAGGVHLGMHVAESNKFEYDPCFGKHQKHNGWTFTLALNLKEYEEVQGVTYHKLCNMQRNRNLSSTIPSLSLLRYAIPNLKVDGILSRKNLDSMPDRLEPFKKQPSTSEKILNIVNYKACELGSDFILVGNSMSRNGDGIVLKLNIGARIATLYPLLHLRCNIMNEAYNVTDRLTTSNYKPRPIVFKDIKTFSTSVNGMHSVLVLGGDTEHSSANMESFILKYALDEYLIHWKRILMDNIPKLSGYTCDVVGGIYYLFGGRDRSKSLNKTLYQLKYSMVQGVGRFTSYKQFDMKKHYITCPEARYDHFSFQMRGMIYIYGGFNELGVPLNDMYRYDTSMNEWTKINMKGAVPPSIRGSVAFTSSTYAYMYSGKIQYHQDEKYELPTSYSIDKCSNSLYRFSFQEKQWKLISFLQYPTDLKLAYMHQVEPISFSSGVLFIGTNNNGHKQMVSMSNLTNEGVAPQRFLDLWKAARDESYTDLILRVSYIDSNTGDSKIGEIHAHQVILASRCEGFKKLIDDAYTLLEDDEEEEDNAQYVYGPANKPRKTVILSFLEYDYEVVKAYVEYLYTGGMHLKESKNESHVKNLLKFAEILSPSTHYYFVSRMCKRRAIDLEWVNLIYIDMNKAYLNILKENLYTDFELLTEEGERFPCHRVFLTRLVHFKSIIDAGMLEAVEGRAIMRDIEPEVLKIFIDYLYSDRIQVPLDLVVPTLLFAFQLSLKPISQHCRAIVRDALTIQNVFDVHDIAINYRDSALQQIAAHYLADPKVYEFVKNDPKFSNPEYSKTLALCERKWNKHLRKRNIALQKI